MPEKYRVSAGDPDVGFDDDGLLKSFAAQLKTRGVVTDAQFSTAIDNMTSAQFEAFLRALVKKWIKVG